MRVLITGGTGFIGRAVASRIGREGHEICVTTRGAAGSGIAPSGVRYLTIESIGPATEWSAAVRNVDIVIHLAARAHVLRETSATPVEEYERVNVGGTMSLARAAAAAGVRRMVFVSSAGVGGNTSGAVPLHESQVPAPKTPYALSKWHAEQQLLAWSAETGLECVIVRPVLVYGPDAPGNLRRLMGAIVRGVPLPFRSVSNARSMVGVDNLADLLWGCATRSGIAGQTYYATDGAISTPELVRILAEGLNKAARLFPVPVGLIGCAARMAGKRAMFEQLCGTYLVDGSKLENALEWRPAKAMHAGLREMAAAFGAKEVT